MPDQITEVTRAGLGSRMGRSVGQVGIGLIMFITSFAVLYWNEGRKDMSIVAKTSVPLKADVVDGSADGKLVAVEGKITTEDTVSDNFVLLGSENDTIVLKQSNVLAIQRNVEYFVWVEDKQTKTNKEVGGSEKTETTYNYKKDWVSKVPKSNQFKETAGHENPMIESEDLVVRVVDAKIGNYTFDTQSIVLPPTEALTIKREMFDSLPKNARLDGGQYVYIGSGNSMAPQIGDRRVRYSIAPVGKEVTVFGKLEGTQVVAFMDNENNTLYRIFNGTKDQATAELHSEYKMMLWIFRILGLFLMWMGLASLFAPFVTLLDILPAFGSLSRSLVSIVAFFIALVLSVVTIIVSAIIHNIVALVVTAGVVLVVVVMIIKRWGKRKAAVQA